MFRNLLDLLKKRAQKNLARTLTQEERRLVFLSGTKVRTKPLVQTWSSYFKRMLDSKSRSSRSPLIGNKLDSRGLNLEALEPRIVLAAAITATKIDAFTDLDADNKVDPGQTITYTIDVANTGTTDATHVTFMDPIDPNTTLVGGSVSITPIAADDTYAVTGNVSIIVPAGGASPKTSERIGQQGSNSARSGR